VSDEPVHSASAMSPRSLPGPTTFWAIREPTPGEQWRALFEATWSSYRAWYLQDGDVARPRLDVARRQLGSHMPELVPTWERLVELADGDETAARMLTLWNPPAFLPGCSQAVLTGDTPALVRNYDYRPDLCERVIYSSAFTGRRVLGMSDCLWGLVDGMNDAGLAASVAFGGRRGAGEGFGIPLVVRYLLEVAETVADVRTVLSGLPVNMAYNITVLDRNADAATIFVAPGAEPEVFRLHAATNHRGTSPEDPEHARTFHSVQRQQALLHSLQHQPEVDAFVAEFLASPLYTTAYEQGFGTMYTAVYRPGEGMADFVWPTSTWRRSFDSPSGSRVVALGPPDDGGNASRRSGDRRPVGRFERVQAGLDEPWGRAQARDVTSRMGVPDRTPDELAHLARAAIAGLARSDDPQAFAHLLQLSQQVGECLGVSARNLASGRSWSGVADLAGTTRQAAWARWSR
jgi:predicted choloylglycine hydrolase